MQRYRFEDGRVCSPDSEAWGELLRRAYAAHARPVCLCCDESDGPPLYLSLVRGSPVLKRMPHTGRLHAAHCEHYEAPPELTGAGQVLGSAIREDPSQDTTALTLGFALAKGAPRSPPATAAVLHESVRGDGTRLTLRALLHYLYDEAGLSRWTPRMAGRRSWAVVQRELLAAAAHKTTQGLPLPAVLFLPEPFRAQQAPEILARRQVRLARLSVAAAARMVFIAPVKRLEPARYGHRLLLMHLPDMPLHVNDELHRRMTTVFRAQLALWDQLPDTQLLAIGTLSRTAHGVFELEAACLVNVNAGWLPFETLPEHQLLEALVERRFSKGLRYNLPPQAPLASVVLHDTDPPTALYLAPPDTAEDGLDRSRALANGTGLASWWWRGDGPVPALPTAGPRPRPSAVDSPDVEAG